MLSSKTAMSSRQWVIEFTRRGVTYTESFTISLRHTDEINSGGETMHSVLCVPLNSGIDTSFRVELHMCPSPLTAIKSSIIILSMMKSLLLRL